MDNKDTKTMNNKSNNKYIYGYKLHVNYGDKWEYECFEHTFREAREQARYYRENCSYPIKISKGRETNPYYIAKSDIKHKAALINEI